MRKYKITEDAGYALCPWVLSRDGRVIAQFTTESRAEEYRDWLIEEAKRDGSA